jgi:uncharacterized protein (DUF1697 family)
MALYVALLRGINVGGKNLIKMADLAACFEALGFTEVRTYIQSGNVIFRADARADARASAKNQAALTGLLEEVLSRTFGYSSTVVLRSHKAMQEIVARAPEGFGSEPSAYRYDVIFLKEPLDAAEAAETIPAKEGVDRISAGKGVVYASRLISRATQSHISRIVALPIYPSLTIRNWNTTTKLLALLDVAGD